LDADDRVAPDFYRRAVALLRQYENAAYVGSWLRLFGDAEGYKAYFPSSLPALLLDNTQASGCVIRRDVFLAAALFNLLAAFLALAALKPLRLPAQSHRG
jgi:cellulose synthase/poly-beta-1,6-N-acetylglucosamine synthase-like glycosyltransferase